MNERSNSIIGVSFCLNPVVLTVTIPMEGWEFDSRFAVISDLALMVSPAKVGFETFQLVIPSMIPFLLVSPTLRPRTMERTSREFTTSLPSNGGSEKFFSTYSLL